MEFVILGLSCAFSVLALALSAWTAKSSAPARLKSDMDELLEGVKNHANNIERLYAAWGETKLNLANMLEAVTDLAETTETKRKRIAAKEGREKRQVDGEGPAPGTPEYRDALEQSAIARGLI